MSPPFPESFMDARHNETVTLDVRPLTEWKRHYTFFSTFAALKQGETFVLVNDHTHSGSVLI